MALSCCRSNNESAEPLVLGVMHRRAQEWHRLACPIHRHHQGVLAMVGLSAGVVRCHSSLRAASACTSSIVWCMGLMGDLVLAQADWFAKHRQRRPAVAAVFLDRSTAPEPAPRTDCSQQCMQHNVMSAGQRHTTRCS